MMYDLRCARSFAGEDLPGLEEAHRMKVVQGIKSQVDMAGNRWAGAVEMYSLLSCRLLTGCRCGSCAKFTAELFALVTPELGPCKRLDSSQCSHATLIEVRDLVVIKALLYRSLSTIPIFYFDQNTGETSLPSCVTHVIPAYQSRKHRLCTKPRSKPRANCQAATHRNARQPTHSDDAQVIKYFLAVQAI
jgi:hypothetical protein